LLERGFDVGVVNRTVARGDDLVRHFRARPRSWAFEELPRLLPDARFLVNTTSLGAKGQPPLDINLQRVRPEAVVCDINYVPLETGLLRAARHLGHRTADGLGMLMHQGVPGFARWFGVRPAVTPGLRQLLESDIRAREGAG